MRFVFIALLSTIPISAFAGEPGAALRWKYPELSGYTLRREPGKQWVLDWGSAPGTPPTTAELDAIVLEYRAALIEQAADEKAAQAVATYERLQSLKEHRLNDPALADDKALRDAIDAEITKLEAQLVAEKGEMEAQE